MVERACAGLEWPMYSATTVDGVESCSVLKDVTNVGRF